jgi:DNA-binding GntR family transcriptional regulator
MPAGIDKSAPEPYFDQLAEILRRQIEDGALTPRAKLPTQLELVELYEVSRGTASRATEILVGEGLAFWSKGKGLFVSGPDVIGPWRKERRAARRRQA